MDGDGFDKQSLRSDEISQVFYLQGAQIEVLWCEGDLRFSKDYECVGEVRDVLLEF